MFLSADTYDTIMDDSNWCTVWTLVPEYHLLKTKTNEEVKGKSIQVFDFPCSSN